MSRLRGLFDRRRLEEQLEKELRFHIEQHTADLIAHGQDPEEARRQARLALGGPEQVKEKCRDARGTRWIEELFQDLRYALRSFRQRPGFTAAALCTLALGIGAATVMFTVINSVLFKPLSYPEPSRLMSLHSQTEKYDGSSGISYLDFIDCQRESRSVVLAAWAYGGGMVSRPGKAEYVDGRLISPGLLSVLGIPLVKGHAFSAKENLPGAAPVAIISYGLWQRWYGGNPEAIGEKLIYDGKAYTVVGIAPAKLKLGGEGDVFTPLGQATELRMRSRGARFLNVIGRLRQGVAPAESQAELSLIAARLAKQYPEANTGVSMVEHPLRQELVGDVRSTLWLLMGAVSLLLLIACVNIASLLLARAVSREHELAMRAALGAGRSRLIRQCLTESTVLGVCGGALGVLLATAAVHPFVVFWPGSLPRSEDVRLDWHVLLFTLAISLLSSFLFGLAPALRAPSGALEQALRAGSHAVTGSSRRLHSIFVASQIAFAAMLLVTAGILGRTLLRLSSLDPGFEARNALSARVALSPGALSNPAQTRAAWREVLDRARQVPGVQSAALVDTVPMREGINPLGYRTTAAPVRPDQETFALVTSATPDYLKVMRIPLLRGRFIGDGDRVGSQPVIVVDEALAQHAFGGIDVVGKQLWVAALAPGPVRIVGVVGHVRHWGLAGDDVSKIRDQIYCPFAQVPDFLMHFFSSVMSIVIRTEIPPLNAVEPLRRALRGDTGGQALYEVRAMEQLVSASLARQRFLSVLFGVFAGVALLLACIGIYGVMSYLTSQRAPEIGVRMALGASPREIMRMILRQSLGMILAGAAAGAVAAFAAGRILQRLLPGVRSTEPSAFIAMIAVLAFAALFASFPPARRASRVDPIRALRQE